MSELLSRSVAALSPSIIRVMSRMRKPSSIDLSLGQPALTPDPEIVERANRRYWKGPTGYTDTGGAMELRELIAQHYRLPGRDKGTNVIVTVGSEEAVFLGLLASVDPGDEILMPEPGYPAYPGIAQLLGAYRVPYPIARRNGLTVRAADLEERITKRTRAIVLNSPSNPFGTIDAEEELRAIADLVELHGLVVLSDEIYGDLYYTGSTPPSIARMTDRALFISGLSKSCAMTGLRIGYLIAPESFVPQASLAHQLMVTCAATPSQLAAIEIFSQPELLRAHLPYYESARAALRANASALPSDAPMLLGDGAFYAIIDVEKYANGDAMKLALALLEEEDVVVVPGNAFGPSGTWFWRLSYASGPEASGEGLKRIGRFLSKRHL